MDIKEFFGKFVSRIVIWNLLAMVLVVIALIVGVIYGLDNYTRHGEGIEVPNLYGMEFDEAVDLLAKDNVLVVANDTGYNKQMGADCILMQMPGAGTKVKGGRVVYVTINSTSSPKVKIPDIIDNSSYREATARLTAIGFVLNEPEVVDGERDWVYGIKAGFTELHAGDMISIETPLTLVIGNGTSEESGEDAMLDVPDPSEMGEEDDFEEMGGTQ